MSHRGGSWETRWTRPGPAAPDRRHGAPHRHRGRPILSETPPTAPQGPEPDYDGLLRANLARVFNEREAGRRAAALADLYVAEPVMFEPTNVVAGRSAIAAVAGTLLEQFGPTFRFTPVGPAVGHHGLGSLRWQAGPDGGPVVVTGTDVAEVVDGRIARLWVLLDPPAA